MYYFTFLYMYIYSPNNLLQYLYYTDRNNVANKAKYFTSITASSIFTLQYHRNDSTQLITVNEQKRNGGLKVRL